MRTATERRSVLELARLIGYDLAPGVAAEALLAFTLDDAKGAPGQVALNPGIKVQSIPGPGEMPQTFETVESLDARAGWNALHAQRTQTFIPQFKDTEVYFAGVTTGLKVGDWILFVGTEREDWAASNQWDFRPVLTVTPDLAHNVTHVTWDEGLGWTDGTHTVLPAAARGMKAYALRSRASLWGYNAPDVRLLTDDVRNRYVPDNTTIPEKATEWPNFTLSKIDPKGGIHLDGSVPQAIPQSWIVLAKPDATGDPYEELYKVTHASSNSQNGFGLAGKTTHLTIEGEHLSFFDNQIRQTTVHIQSEQLTIAEKPIADSVPAIADATVEPGQVILDRLIDDLDVGRKLLFRGPRAHVVVTGIKTKLAVKDEDAVTQPFTFDSHDVLEVLEPPATAADWIARRASSINGTPTPNVTFSDPNRLYHLRNALGEEGYVITPPTSFDNDDPPPGAEVVSELVTVKQITEQDGLYTKLIFDTPLTMVYDRPALIIQANVVKATHGESVAEALGAGTGDPFQTFALKQSPLTYTRSLASDSGAASTLQVTVNDLIWNEVDNFFDRGSRERIFITRQGEGGATSIEFGDGVTGARLPSGQENIRASYRKGIGLAAQVKTDQLSLLVTRPLGVRSVTNPLPAANAEDAEVIADAAVNAPPTVLTLGRVVSLRDYEDFARVFAGVSKALANWTFDHNARGVYVTVAGVNGAAVADNSDLQATLIEKLQLAGNPRVPIRLHGYRPAYFRVSAQVKVDVANGYQQDPVFDQVRAALASRFAFAVRSFGQPVSLSEVVAVIQNVAGVVAVDIQQLYRTDHTPGAEPETLLGALTPGDGNNADAVLPAELLMIDPDQTPVLEPMP